VSRFRFIATPIEGLMVVERQRIEDSRGFLSRLFCAEELAAHGFTLPVAQINHTLTRQQGAVRGMHFQHPPHAEDKLVGCLRGQVFDVAVDLRRGSSTYLRWHAETLSAENGKAFLIPQGFAHGFQALEEDCELLYLHSRPYAAQAEGALNARDPVLDIRWPLAITDMSTRDMRHPHLTPTFTGI